MKRYFYHGIIENERLGGLGASELIERRRGLVHFCAISLLGLNSHFIEAEHSLLAKGTKCGHELF